MTYLKNGGGIEATGYPAGPTRQEGGVRILVSSGARGGGILLSTAEVSELIATLKAELKKATPKVEASV